VGLPVHSLRRPAEAPFQRAAARLFTSAAVLCVVAGAVPTLAFATAAKGSPDAIACPSAPAGWGHPPVTKTVSAPQTTENGYGGGYEQVAAGGNAATVTCAYHTPTSKQVYVAVSFALPTDPNPNNDFDLGCSRGDASWNAADRVYRVSSPDQWALATLVDDSRALRGSEVPAFQAVTRKLLHNAAGYGHACVVVTRPTQVPARFFFDIRAGGDNIKSTFWTPPSPGRSGVFPIQKISPSTARLRVETSSGSHLLAVRLTRGVDYRLQKAQRPARVRVRFTVTGSNVGSCHGGATGTMTISPPLTVQLEVCGHTYTPVVTSLIKIYTS